MQADDSLDDGGSGQGYGDSQVSHSVRAFYAEDEDGEELPWRRDVRRASRGDVSGKSSVFYPEDEDEANQSGR